MQPRCSHTSSALPYPWSQGHEQLNKSKQTWFFWALGFWFLRIHTSCLWGAELILLISVLYIEKSTLELKLWSANLKLTGNLPWNLEIRCLTDNSISVFCYTPVVCPCSAASGRSAKPRTPRKLFCGILLTQIKIFTPGTTSHLWNWEGDTAVTEGCARKYLLAFSIHLLGFYLFMHLCINIYHSPANAFWHKFIIK